MKLTPAHKAYIDSMSQVELLRTWRFTLINPEWFHGETGEYWGARMAELRQKDPAGHTAASKQIGWNAP